MGKKKPAVGATVPPPSQGEDFFSQLMNTFERGIVSAEIDLGGVMPKKQGGGSVVTKLWGEAAPIDTGPRGVHNQIFKRMKEIAAAYGGKFTVHAPMDANPAGSTGLERLEAAEILKQSIEYADKLGGSVLTVHPIGPMGYYFIEPIVGTKMPVKNPFLLAANEKELEDLFKKYNVKDELLKKQIKREWENWVQTLPMNLAEKFGAQGKELLDQFSSLAALRKLVEVAENSKDRNELLSKIADMKANGYHDLVLEKISSRLSAILNEKGEIDKERLKRMKEYVDKLEKAGVFEREWARANLASIRPISPDGKVAYDPREEAELRKKAWEALMKKTERFGPFDDSVKSIKEHVKETFKSLLDDKEVQEILKKGKLKIALENLFPANPEKGYMQGVPYFYEPEHMAEIIKEIRNIAKAKGIPEDAITITFDLGHAAASGIKPSEFLEKLKKEGIEPGHIHIVGGPGYGHAHIAWGDWLDEVSRMDPEIVKKLVDVGVINIEGGAGLHDVEVTLNALWNEGVPLEALLAMASAPDRVNPGLARYAGYQPPAYWEKTAYNLARSGFAERAFYSFSNPTIGAPLRSSFYEFTIPAYSSGGIGFRNTPAIWHSSQPLLYSSKRR